MNILYIADNTCEHDVRILSVVKSLLKNNHTVNVLAWDNRNEKGLYYEPFGIPIFMVKNSWLMNQIPFNIIRMHLWFRKGYTDYFKLELATPDLIMCTDLSTFRLAIKFKKKFNVPLIYCTDEIWGLSIKQSMPNWVADFYLWYEKLILKYADGFVSSGKYVHSYYEKLTDVPMIILPSYRNPTSRYAENSNDIFTVLYLGGFGPSRYIHELIDVVSGLDGVQLILGGHLYNEKYSKMVLEKCSNSSNCKYIGYVDNESIVNHVTQSDVVFGFRDPNIEITRIGLPNKLFEAMAGGRPIITTKGTYAAELTEQFGTGISTEFNKDSLREGLMFLRDNKDKCNEMGRTAYEKCKEEFNWDNQEKKLLRLIKEVKNGRM